jgi:hydrogenase maturation protease
MSRTPVRCLILACGNTLREDDGVGPFLADWAELRFIADPAVRVLTRQQWTPDLAAEIAEADSVIFLDCSVESAPGSVHLAPVEPVAAGPGLATHHTGAPELLALSRELYDSLPSHVVLLTVGAASTALREGFSESVAAALPEARRLLENAVMQFLANPNAATNERT